MKNTHPKAHVGQGYVILKMNPIRRPLDVPGVVDGVVGPKFVLGGEEHVAGGAVDLAVVEDVVGLGGNKSIRGMTKKRAII